MSEEKFKVPELSLSEIERVIDGYSHGSGEVTREDICRLTGVSSTTASRANTFLKEISLIDGGHKKTATELGRRLGKAIHHEQSEDEQRLWQEAIKGNEFLSGLVSTVRIRKGMTPEDLASHVLYAAGAKVTTHKKTGANTVVEILKKANLLEEQGDKLQVVTSSANAEVKDPEKQTDDLAPDNSQDTTKQNEEVVGQSVSSSSQQATPSITPTIAINIQLQLPETENPVVYDNLFKSLRANLLEPKLEENG